MNECGKTNSLQSFDVESYGGVKADSKVHCLWGAVWLSSWCR